MISRLTNLLKKYSLFCNKKLGQHFLVNNHVLLKEIEFAKINKSDTVLEIGSGPGFLTELLAQHTKRVITIEQDPRYVNLLKNELSKYENIEIINEDALKIEWPQVNKIVANIPYKISSKIMDKLSAYQFELAIICFQKEFAERLSAKENEKNYSKLSVFSNYYFDIKIRMDVKASSFYPQPKVNSQIVEIKKNKKIDIEREEEFFNLIKAIFCYKRKTLNNALKYSKGVLKKEINTDNIDSILLQKKVISLNLDDLVAIYKKINIK